MNLQITSDYKKGLKYRVYSTAGGKRKLLKKGRFKNETRAEFTPNGNEVIVRVSKANTFFFAFFIWLLNIITMSEDLEVARVNWFYEIRVTIADFSQPLILGFDNLEGAAGDVVSVFEGTIEPVRRCTPLYCANHPFAAIFDKNKAVNRAFIIVIVICVLALICALIPLVGKGFVVL